MDIPPASLVGALSRVLVLGAGSSMSTVTWQAADCFTSPGNMAPVACPIDNASSREEEPESIHFAKRRRRRKEEEA